MKNEVWTRLFGFEVNKEMKEIILAEVAKTGQDIRKVIARYTLPEFAMLDDEGKFDYHGQRVTLEEWRKINPLGEYARIAAVKRRDYNETTINK
jgi:hypothetical protein